MAVGDDAVEKTAERGGAAVPSGPKLDRPKKWRGRPNPFLVVGAALALGFFLAKVLDWRSHAHPRD